ncbi:MAG: hypothetical protein ACI4SF_09335 [Oscillospiraceae bacterium]
MKNKNKDVSLIQFTKAALPIAAALSMIFLLGGFIVYKAIVAYNHYERWKDYDECGLS